MRRSIVVILAAFAATAAFAGVPFYSNYGGLFDPANPGLSTGAVTNSGVPAPAGFEWSEVANDTPTGGNGTAGFSGHAIVGSNATSFRLADNFSVFDGEAFDLDSVCFYAYQTGSTSNPFAGVNLRIWQGDIGDPNSTLVFGDATTNRLTSVTNTNLYRIFNTVAPPPGTAPGTTRLIRQLDVAADITLGPGDYWLDWQVVLGSGASAFFPSITIPGIRGIPGWLAGQYAPTTTDPNGPANWFLIVDGGNPTTLPDVPQDLPYILKGAYIPEPASLLLIGLAGLMLRRR